ncbi:hypothetical protein B0H15DRAFT_998941 [Mycena belliarum]|uniref:Uncharacterized protein n=1 Tax=Mycena belliarum TaxID=1033014 RepID=A0AAD6XXP6_9AGAR|nr:hypothetical protein B0H15DRAFT_998941 [Mycena belliae]
MATLAIVPLALSHHTRPSQCRVNTAPLPLVVHSTLHSPRTTARYVLLACLAAVLVFGLELRIEQRFRVICVIDEQHQQHLRALTCKFNCSLLQLMSLKISCPVVEYVVDCVSEAVDHALGRAPAPRGRSATRSPLHTKFTAFVSTMLERSHPRPHLPARLPRNYTNDSTLKNVHWALCSGVFGRRDVGRIEREFLAVLDWELAVASAELLAHHAALADIEVHARSHHLAVPSAHLAVPRPTHKRHTSVPALEPSSPASSAASMSPRTPASPHRVNFPRPHPKAKDAYDAPAPSFHDLLRAFPVPHPVPHQYPPGLRVAVH